MILTKLHLFLLMTFVSTFVKLVVLEHGNTAEDPRQFLLVSKNAKLDVTPIVTFEAEQRESCLGFCIFQSECNGINVKTSVSGAFTCELLSEKHAYHHDKEVEEPGTWYFTVQHCGECAQRKWLHTTVGYYCDCRHVFTAEKDCYSHRMKKRHENGLYKIQIDASIVEVFCDMTFQDGGWIVIQRRIDGRQDFHLNWTDYKRGFGSKKHEYWLGNDNIHKLTATRSYEFVIVIEAFTGEHGWSKYENFRIENETELYKLSLNPVADELIGERMMERANGMNFTTKDKDNDEYDKNCAVAFTGAWWYKRCHRSNLNGKYQIPEDGDACYSPQSIVWSRWPNATKEWQCLKHVLMMIREAQVGA